MMVSVFRTHSQQNAKMADPTADANSKFNWPNSSDGAPGKIRPAN
jgi:hypothetical protein